MTEEEKRAWDVRIASIGPLLTVLTLMVGVWQFRAAADARVEEQAAAARLQDDLQFRRKLWSDGLESCRAVTELAARIAAEAEAGDPVDELAKQWSARYWGVSLTLDPRSERDEAIREAIIEFRVDLGEFTRGERTQEMVDRLRVHAFELGQACSERVRAGSSDLLARARAVPE